MLDRLSRNKGSRKPRRRVGRGPGSGLGKTCGRGQKGAGSRSGSKRRTWNEGGQMPLSRRLPKFGFHNLFRKAYQVVNVKDLGRFEGGAMVGPEALAEAGLVSAAAAPIKILAEGDLSVSLTVQVDAASESAKKKIEGAGGTVELLPQPRRPKKKEDAGA